METCLDCGEECTNDRCACGLCPACCDRTCRVQWWEEGDAYTSRCGTCGLEATRDYLRSQSRLV